MKLRRMLLSTSIALWLLATLVGGALAQSGGDYDLTWNTADSGSYALSGGGYTLENTVGQAEAGALSASSYALSSGFRLGGEHRVYLPLVLRGL